MKNFIIKNKNKLTSLTIFAVLVALFLGNSAEDINTVTYKDNIKPSLGISWSQTACNGGVCDEYMPTTTVVVDQNINLKATTTTTASIVCDANGGYFIESGSNVSSYIQNVPFGTGFTRFLVTPKRVGSVFKGWYNQAIGGTQYTYSSSPTSNSFTIYAHWDIANYEVILNLNYKKNGDQQYFGTIDVEYDQKYNSGKWSLAAHPELSLDSTQNGGAGNGTTNLPTPVRAGYDFLGWYTDPDKNVTDYKVTGSTILTDCSATSTCSSSSYATCSLATGCNTVLYAHWRARGVDISYSSVDTNTIQIVNPDDNSSLDTVKVTFDNPYTLPGEHWKAYGYKMVGWSSDNRLNQNTETLNSLAYVGDVNEYFSSFILDDEQFTCTEDGCTTTLYSVWEKVPMQLDSPTSFLKAYSYDYGTEYFAQLEIKEWTGSTNYRWKILNPSSYFIIDEEKGSIKVKALDDGRYSVPIGTYNLQIECYDLATNSYLTTTDATGTHNYVNIKIEITKFSIPWYGIVQKEFTYDNKDFTLNDQLGTFYNDYVTKENVTKKDAGTYTAVWKIKDPTNVEWANTTDSVSASKTANKSVTWKILKPLNIIEIDPVSATAILNQEITVTVKVNNKNNLKYDVYEATGTVQLSAATKKGTSGDITTYETKITPTAAGTYNITFKSEGGEGYNYEQQSKVLELTVIPGVINIQKINNTFTYNGKEQYFSITTDQADAKIEYSVDGSAFSTAAPHAKDVTNQVVSYKISKPNYTTITGTTNFIINPYILTSANVIWAENVGCIQKGANYTCDYDLERKREPNVIVTGVDVNGDGSGDLILSPQDYTVSYSPNYTGSSWARVSGQGNYGGQVTMYFTIGAGKLTYTLRADKLLDADGNQVEGNSITSTEGGFVGTSVIDYGIEASNGNVLFTVIPTNATVRFSLDGADYSYMQIPTFKGSGIYAVYFKITLEDFDDIEGYFFVDIKPLKVLVPSTSNPCINLDGEAIPEWKNYNPLYMGMGGDTSATEIGNYTTTFDLQDKENVIWVDEEGNNLGSWAQKVSWSVTGFCEINPEDEETYTIGAEYGKYCTLVIIDENTKATFTSFSRPGMIQTGWLQNRNDKTALYPLDANVINLQDEQGETVDLYALWQTATYNIKIDYDGGSVQYKNYVLEEEDTIINEETGESTVLTPISRELKTNPTVISYGSYFTLTEPSKPGYTFKGWSIWNMDESEHIIGSVVTHEKTYKTIESYFMNLTSVADSTVYFKAIWELNELWTFNSNSTITTTPSAQQLPAVSPARNGSGTYSYKILSISPMPTFTNGVVHNEDNFGFTLDTDTLKIKVPGYLEAKNYVIQLMVTDDFTTQVKSIYMNLAVNNPKVIVDSKEYEYTLEQKWGRNDGIWKSWHSWPGNDTSSIEIINFAEYCLANNTGTNNNYKPGTVATYYGENRSYLGKWISKASTSLD